MCQTPEYFMQVLAWVMDNSGDWDCLRRFVFELNVADRYEDAKSRIISSAVGGIKEPHWTESYYILSIYVKEKDFY